MITMITLTTPVVMVTHGLICRRDNGLEALAAALARCVVNVGMLTKPEDMETKVCTFIVRCFSESAAFESAREKVTRPVLT